MNRRRTEAIRDALYLALVAMGRPGSRVVSAGALVATLGISRSAAYRHLHAAADAAGVRLWRSAWGLVVERVDG